MSEQRQSFPAVLKVLIFLAVLTAAVLPFALRGTVATWGAVVALVVLALVFGVIGLVMGQGE